MGRVKSELMTDGPDDDLVPKSSVDISAKIQNAMDELTKAIDVCQLPLGSRERDQYIKTQMEELMNGIRTNLD